MTRMTRVNIDNEIKKRVQSVETGIPEELEKTLMKELQQLDMAIATPPRAEKEIRFLRGSLAAAASVLVAALLLVALFPSLFRQTHVATTGVPEEDCAFVDSARVEGIPADTIIITQKDPDMTIVWVEKAPLTIKNR